jgi:hypothetical protein
MKQIALEIINALKGNPAMLALSLTDIALLVFIFYALHGSASYRETLIKQVLDNSSRINDMMQTRSLPCGPTLQSDESKPAVLSPKN